MTRWVGDRHRIVEEHHDAITRELVERSLELADKRTQRPMVLAKEIEHLFGFGGLGEGGVAAQVQNTTTMSRRWLSRILATGESLQDLGPEDTGRRRRQLPQDD
jgi:hypothetical protein